MANASKPLCSMADALLNRRIKCAADKRQLDHDECLHGNIFIVIRIGREVL